MIDLSEHYLKHALPKEKKSYIGVDKVVNWFAGKLYKQFTMKKRFLRQANIIREKSIEYQNLSDEELYEKIIFFKSQFKLKKKEQYYNQAIASLIELTDRILHIRPYDVQIMGILAQDKNFLIEMLPGEGKTITAAISAILFAWIGKPCHVITSNDYLAKRDALEMEVLFNAAFVSVGYIEGSMENEARKENYEKDIVYATGKELLADFLRDQMLEKVINYNSILIKSLQNNQTIEEKVMRGLYSAIVDEADSVLADEAVTPLIISVPSQNNILKDSTIAAKDIIETLIKDDDYSVDVEYKDIKFTPKGEKKIKKHKEKLHPIWRLKSRSEFLIKQALIAKYFYLKDIHYTINEDDEIQIVDEKTGRIMDGRSWGSGLHQAIEAKEGLEISPTKETSVKMSFQRFFRLYQNLSGMSGTLQNLEKEFWHIYKLPIIKIPKRIPNTYELLEPKIYPTYDLKIEAVIENIIEVSSKTQRPILVGAKDIKESEYLSKVLNAKGYPNQVLNALYHEEEDEIVSEAGKQGMITIATNIAGRGTDIKIIGEIESLGGLHVIATQKFTSLRVDLQLYGRTSRQGQKGSVQQIFSLEDELIKQYTKPWVLKILQKSLQTKYGIKTLMFYYSYIQKKIESVSTSSRIKMLENDFSMIERLSFTSNRI
jgi:preprotein translocase subunit SecA